MAFRPGCMKLRKNLMSYNLCDPEHCRDVVGVEDVEVVDVDYILVDDDETAVGEGE